jgi:hypothetical protein
MNQIHNAIGSTGGYISGGSGNQNSNNMSGAIGAGISMLGGLLGARNQHRRQRQLMGVQYQNQRLLNQHGHDLQYDMWKKTNYPAQVQMMKEAGLNPALMYGSAGQGGTTGSQGGGSAASGNAASFQAMDLSNMMLAKAQAKDLEASARLKNVDADKKEGVDTQEAISRAELNTINKLLNDHDYKWLKEKDLSRQSYGPLKAIKEASGENYERIFKAIDRRVGEIMDVADDPIGAVKDKVQVIKDVIEEGIDNTEDLLKRAYDKWKNRKKN